MIEFAPNIAHITSWIHRECGEVFYLSPLVNMTVGTAVRGGVPICWPWFGSKEGAPSHGFARTNKWNLIYQSGAGEPLKYVFNLPRQVMKDENYPEGFLLEFEVEERDGLTMKLTCYNNSKESIEITQALHSYFKIGHIKDIVIEGLDGMTYFDKVSHSESTQVGKLKIDGEVDRIYLTDRDTILIDPILKRKLIISKSGSKSTVIWNPGQKKSASISDLPDADYQYFCCVESANTHLDPVVLNPGDSHTLMQSIQIEQL